MERQLLNLALCMVGWGICLSIGVLDDDKAVRAVALTSAFLVGFISKGVIMKMAGHSNNKVD